MTIHKHRPDSAFSLYWHREGHEAKLIAANLSDDEAQRRLEELSKKFGQPILPELVVNESSEDSCRYYYVVERLPEEGA
jgi:hypothetical protein